MALSTPLVITPRGISSLIAPGVLAERNDENTTATSGASVGGCQHEHAVLSG